MRHASFIARTILTGGDPEAALRIINRIMAREGLMDQYKRTRRYEKPYMVRRRINYERCTALYNEDMTRKIKFLMRKNRADPFPAS